MRLKTAAQRWQWWMGGAVVVIVAAVLGVVVSRPSSRQSPAASSSAPSLPTTPSSPVASSLSSTPSSTSPTPTSPTPTSAATDCVAATLAKLSSAERVGQLLMIGVAVEEPGLLGASVDRYHLGGVFLHGRSSRSAADLRRDVAALQRHATVPLLVSLDQEGGSVQTLKGADFPILPSAQRLGAGPSAILRATTADSARRLAGVGVTVNLAPVADTVPASLGRANPPIGAYRRQFGSDPVRVANSIATVVPASQDAGVLTVLKHFPGLGRVRFNTDTSDKAVDFTTTADDPYLEPFRAGIRAGSAGVMISSADYPRLDDQIAAFSRPIVTGLLREKLGFQGLIMSDDLGAGVAVSRYGTGERAVRFVAAGGDLVLTIRPGDTAPMSKALLDKAGNDPAFRERVGEAARHVLAAKQRAGLLTCHG
jgi:beta-N-acetylhexosaminidase